MKLFKQLENGWEKYWEERVNQDAEYYGKHGSDADKIIKILKINKKDKVLDIGCAVGAHLSDIKDKTKADCYGMDISPVAVSLCRDKRLKLKVADMAKTGYPKNFFTKVFTLGVFEHTPNSIKPFMELNRIMKLNGLAYITVPNKFAFNHITKNIKMLIGKWDLGYEKSFTKSEIINLLNKSGFKLEKYWVEPHLRVANIFNWADNFLNRINSQYFGFFIHILVKKSKEIK